MYEKQFTQSQAREALHYLKRGVCPHRDINFFTVGLNKESDLINDILRSIRSGAIIGENYFLEAPYGYGKSHLLKVVESLAIRQKFAVTQVTHDGYDRAFNHPARYIHHLFENLLIPGLSTRGLGNAIPHLLRSSQRSSLLDWTNTPSVRWGIGSYVRQIVNASDTADLSSLRYLINCRDIQHRSTSYYYLLYEKLKILVDFCRAINLSGLVVLFDEVESIAVLLRNILSRLRSYEILYKLTDPREFPHCFFCFAITPDFGYKIENSDYQYEYDYYKGYYPDGCRFMEAWVGGKPKLLPIAKINIADNVDLCYKLKGLHEYAYSWSTDKRISSALIESFVDEAERRSLLERDIVRSFVNILDICQQHTSCNPSQELSLTSNAERRLTEPGIQDINKVLLALTPSERRVIHLRFGLEDGTSHTLEEIGRKLDLTRERIRQIEVKALRKLRHPSRSRKLRGMLDSRHRLHRVYDNLLRAVFGEGRQ